MLASSTPSISNSMYRMQFSGKYAFNPTRPSLLYIESYDHLTDTVKIAGSVETKVTSLHPVVTDSSWIRAGADGGQALGIQRTDNNEIALTNYQSVKPNNRIKAYYNGNGFYRPIHAGEIEINSRGLAQSYYTKEPVLEHKAGVIRQWLDQNRLTLGAKAPCHQRIAHEKEAGAIIDEERFGIVKRYRDGSNLLEQYFTVDGTTPDGNGNLPSGYAKEYLRVFKNATGILEDLRVGDVIDDTGNTVKLTSTGNPLRLKHEYYMDDGSSKVSTQIDSKGNMSMKFPSTVDKVSLTNAGKNIEIRTDKDYSLISDNGSLKARVKENISFECKKFNIGSANERVVLGEQLKSLLLSILTALITHTHTGNLGAPTTGPILGLSELQSALNTVNSDSLFSDFIKVSKAAT